MAALALALALSVGLSGCSGTDEKGEASSAPSSRLLNFTAQTIDGADFAGSGLAGKKAVLWFWAPWCPTCQKEAPDLQKAATAHPDVTFVGVAAQDQVPAMRDFVTKYGLTFIQLADTDAKVWALYDVTHQPAFAFLGSEGKAEVVKSPLSGPELDKKIGQLH
ncbi:Probable conserved lipoprotein DsbF [Mycobacteroides abscessus subsp. bolletii]|uniref:TlpA family protein disulfide reductase n=1 Tax=Mycobacteroides abscessus TaxID=36809 RepID=UPI0009A5FDF7|nr:redoxin domain-containing protein [Mycobacteroides abscessus]SKH70855.1 putative lipoprotein DsbF [Mycobacteroides abscessus subsp. bolletii]SLF60651.1 Probable conserved lipoprotein DsbF [Mycobacteroides abscessus subsp. bolletii]